MIEYPEPSAEDLAEAVRDSPEPLKLFAQILFLFPEERREEIARVIGERCSEILLVHAKRMREETVMEETCSTD